MSRSNLLMDDVETESNKGTRSVLLSKNDSANKVKRYLLRNKRKIGIKVAGVIVLAILAPPALLAYIGGAAASYAGSRVVKWIQLSRAKARIDESDGMATMKTIGGRSDIAEVSSDTFAVRSSIFGDDSLFQDLALIVQRQKLTDIFNTFSELERDYLQLKGDVEKMTAANRIVDCDHAIRLWEGHFRYHARYLDIANNFGELDQAVVMAVINLSGLDDDFKGQFSNLLTNATSGMSETEKKALINDAANDGTVFGHWNERKQDRSKQIQAATASSGIELAPQNPLRLTLGSYAGSMGGTVLTTGLGTGAGAAASAIMHGNAGSLGAGPISISSATGAISLAGAGDIVGLAESVVSPLVEGANRALNARSYASDQHGLIFKRLESHRERIGKIRPLAKDHFEKWATKLVHLNTQHNAMLRKYPRNTGTYASRDKQLAAAVDYLRWIKLRAQVQEHQRYVGEFQALVVEFSIDMDKFEQSQLSAIQLAIQKYVDTDHPAGHCTLSGSGSGICYGALDQELLRLATVLGGADKTELEALVNAKKDALSKTPTSPLRPHGDGKYIYQECLARIMME